MLLFKGIAYYKAQRVVHGTIASTARVASIPNVHTFTSIFTHLHVARGEDSENFS
jgi:hypothetical protein